MFGKRNLTSKITSDIMARHERRTSIQQRLDTLAQSSAGHRLQQAMKHQEDAIERLWRCVAPQSEWVRVPCAEEVRAAVDRHTPRKDDGGYFASLVDGLHRTDALIKDVSQEKEAEDEERSTLQDELAGLEAKGHGVPTSRKGLEALTKEIAKHQEEMDRVQQAISSLPTDSDAWDKASVELESAQHQVDAIAAAGTLGEVSEAEQRAANAALSKARRKAETAQEERDRSEAARRGLERKAGEVVAILEALELVRREIEVDVLEVEWADAERRLVTLLESGDLAGIMRDFRAARDGYARAYQLAYGKAPTIVGGDMLEIEVPLLQHHQMSQPGPLRV